MRRKKGLLCLWLLLVCLCATGCRQRITGDGNGYGEDAGSGSAEADTGAEGASREGLPGESDVSTLKDREARRRAYSEDGDAEVLAGMQALLYTEGEDSEGAREMDGTRRRLEETGRKWAVERVAQQEAQRLHVAETAQEAESALQYYTALLEARSSSLYECKRLNAYWETARDLETVYKTSREHALMIDSGCYDVSARLLEQNLQVAADWVVRKNPDILVKIVPETILGPGAEDLRQARLVCEALSMRPDWAGIGGIARKNVLVLSQCMMESPHLRTAAAVLLARAAQPQLFEDVDADEMVERLSMEATGRAEGKLWYLWKEEAK